MSDGSVTLSPHIVRVLSRLDPALRHGALRAARRERHKLIRRTLQNARDLLLPEPPYSARSAARELASAIRRRQRGSLADGSLASRIVAFLIGELDYLHDLPEEGRIRQLIE
jgi:hypothetical protein